MVKSLFVTASAGSGKTFRLTQEVRRHIERDKEFIVAATFTKAAAARVKVAATTNSASRPIWRRTSWVRRKVFPEPAEAVTKRLFTISGLPPGRGPA